MKRNLLILAIILLIGFIVNSCENDEKCKNDHAYLAIDDPCGGTPYEYAILGTVPVYRTIAVTHSQVDGALSKITAAYTSAATTGGDKADFNNKATEVHIVLGSIASFDTETKVLKIGIDTSEFDIMLAMNVVKNS